ncbi:MAG: Na/Pi cotransporter family protein [Syntrophaceae bacterium]|nr:Na/Pi cotransporter family protein [Syntrophaceae bacterium]
MDKQAGEKMTQVCRSVSEMIEMVFEGFRRPTMESFREVEEAMNTVRKYSTELTGFLISKSSSSEEGREWAKPYLSIASCFDRMTFNIEGIVDRLKSKAENHILFSERGVKEVYDLFHEVMEILENLLGLFLTQDKLLAQRIEEKGRSAFRMISRYAEAHEERLIQGVCVPKSGPIYLGILECLRGIIGHALEVSAKILSLSSSP